jgi:glycerol-3-phosphate acyltransferase PlsY
MIRVVCLLIGYVFGLFQTSYYISKSRGFDIRDFGSGNAGTTNVLRTIGLKPGLMTFIGDCLKCLLAVCLVSLLFGRSHPDMLPLLKMYAAMGAVLGHDYPFYMDFRGGKGVAASVGLLLAFDPIVAACSAVIFFSVFFTTHYVSLGSILMHLGILIEVLILGLVGHFHMTHPHLIELYLLTLALVSLCLWRHRANISRLLQGTEPKTYLKKH